MCDDNFIFNGTISGTDYPSDVQFEYTIGENELACTEDAISTSVLGDDFYFEATYYPVAETKYGKKLCDEAKKKLEDTLAETKDDSWFKEYSNGDFYYYSISSSTDENGSSIYSETSWVSDDEKVVVHAQKELGTSFYISHAAINSDTDNIYAIYLFHPLELALRANVKIYVISLLILIALETLVIFFIRKMYIKSKGYEIMRQDLTRSIAHDLKTPLAITKAYVENWEYIDEADRHEYAEKLISEVDHMTYIINSMLNMSKFDLKKNIKLEEVNIYSMAMAIYERMKPIISERELDVKIYTDNEDGDYYVYADPKMMRIVINNFITNAVKYAQSSINMDFYIHEKTILFVIGNDGTTISKKDIKKIWEPFYKADKTRTDRIGSSGMGLAINKSILKLHNAKFKCTSNAGRTTFSFEMKKVGNNGK
jgi:signal transduction histidine kinase